MQGNREIPMITSAMHKPPALQERGKTQRTAFPLANLLRQRRGI